MATKTIRMPMKKIRNQLEKPIELCEVALAAVTSYKKQKEVTDFINFLLSALERNSNWLNTIVDKQKNFKCALMVGAGPNRFQLQDIIYPIGENSVHLEIEMKDSEDHDKIAIAALINLNNMELDNLSKYMKTRLSDSLLREDLLAGKSLGVTFAILRPISEKVYRVTERITIGTTLKSVEPTKKRRRDEKTSKSLSPTKKSRRLTNYFLDQ